MFKYVINKKYVAMLEFINNKNPNIRDISRFLNSPYLLIRNILIEFQKEKVIEPVFNNEDKIKRDYNIFLTENGRIVLKMLNNIRSLTHGT